MALREIRIRQQILSGRRQSQIVALFEIDSAGHRLFRLAVFARVKDQDPFFPDRGQIQARTGFPLLLDHVGVDFDLEVVARCVETHRNIIGSMRRDLFQPLDRLGSVILFPVELEEDPGRAVLHQFRRGVQQSPDPEFSVRLQREGPFPSMEYLRVTRLVERDLALDPDRSGRGIRLAGSHAQTASVILFHDFFLPVGVPAFRRRADRKIGLRQFAAAGHHYERAARGDDHSFAAENEGHPARIQIRPGRFGIRRRFLSFRCRNKRRGGSLQGFRCQNGGDRQQQCSVKQNISFGKRHRGSFFLFAVHISVRNKNQFFVDSA